MERERELRAEVEERREREGELREMLRRSSTLPYRPTRVLCTVRYSFGLGACYAKSDTDLARNLLWSYRTCYAMSGTDLGHVLPGESLRCLGSWPR
eukprot:1022046-Rhodomonas_salina.1